METLIVICIICATLVILWCIRDVKKQYSRILEEIEEGQKENARALANNAGKIEEGYKILAEMLSKVSK